MGGDRQFLAPHPPSDAPASARAQARLQGKPRNQPLEPAAPAGPPFTARQSRPHSAAAVAFRSTPAESAGRASEFRPQSAAERRERGPQLYSPVRARPGCLSGLSVFHSESVFYGAFVRACRSLNRPER